MFAVSVISFFTQAYVDCEKLVEELRSYGPML